MSKAPHIARNGSSLELDKDWVRTSFMLSHVPNRPTQGVMSKEDKKWLYFTTASQKFVTTGLGGNFVINPPPKYTRYADIPTGLWVDHIVNDRNVKENRPARDRKWAGGLGRYYSESIDDNAYMLHMRFGVPQYKGLVTFFTGFYDISASRLAREGTASLAHLAGRLIGTVVALPFLPVILAYKAAKLFLSTPSTKYYTSKPTMPLYWNRVNMIANSIAVSKGLFPKGKLLFGLGEGGENMHAKLGLETEEMTIANYRDQYEQLRKVVPHWFNGKSSGGVDIQAIIGAPQAVANATRAQLTKLIETAKDADDIQRKYEDYMNKYGADRSIRSSTIDSYLTAYFESKLGNPDLQAPDAYADNINDRLSNLDELMASGSVDDGGSDVSEGAGGSADGTIEGAGGGGVDTSAADEMARAYAENDGLIFPVLTKSAVDANGNSMYERTPVNMQDPLLFDLLENRSSNDLQWLVLKVDAIESVSESFSNQTAQSEIQSKINGMSSTNQAARFSLADFNTGFGVVDEIIKTVKNTISGVAAGLQLDGLVSLTGAGFVDIPERWESSSADFPSASYNLQLRAPYGNLLSQFVNIDVPLACLLAAALPISHGNQSYGAPFLCEMYIQGKNVIRLGMISSLSITRGTGNLGWAPDGSAIGVDVSFTIKDLSTVMHAPIDVSISNPLDPLGGLLPRDSSFHDYLAVLGNMSVHSMTTNTDRIRMLVANKKAMYRNMFTPGHAISALYDTTPGRLLRRINAEQGEVIPTLLKR